MIEKKQKEIINKIEDLDIVKNIYSLKEKLNNNEEYKKLIKESNKKDSDIVKIRKKLFEIEEYKEYMSLSSDVKLMFFKINKIIVSLVKTNTCKNYLNK